MRTAIFTSTGSDREAPSWCSRNGHRVQVLARLTHRDVDQTEVGPMYVVRFSDGVVAHVFADELVFTDRG